MARDCDVFKSAAALKSINLEAWLESVPREELDVIIELNMTGSKSHGNELLVNLMCGYVKEHKEISVGRLANVCGVACPCLWGRLLTFRGVVCPLVRVGFPTFY